MDDRGIRRPMNESSSRTKVVIAELLEDDARGKRIARAEAVVSAIIALGVFVFIASCHGCFHK